MHCVIQLLNTTLEADDWTNFFFSISKQMNAQNERIQELMDMVVQKDDVITKLQDLQSDLEEKVKDYVSFTHFGILIQKKKDPNPMLVINSLLQTWFSVCSWYLSEIVNNSNASVDSCC